MASSSSSMLHALGGQQRNEYPFPVVDPVEPPSSPSDSLPSTSHSKSHRSEGTSRHHRRYDRERDHDFTSASARLLARLASRDERDVKHVRTLLVLTTERLESETRRADQAEQRVVDTLHRLRDAHEATTAARAETTRANDTIQLYKLQLDYAQREIHRAQEIVNQVEQERADAEAEAARARSTARKLKEENLITRAREQGRKEGYLEGLSAGRTMLLAEGRGTPTRGSGRRLPMRATVDEDEDDPIDDAPLRSRSPVRRPSSTFRVSPPQSTFAPRPRLATNFEVRQRSATPSRRLPARDPDVAQHAPALPIPTVTTPARVESPFHAAPSPSPALIPTPVVGSYRHSSRVEPPPPEIFTRVPTPIHNAPPSPTHPPYDIIPDNYIPIANDSSEITLPPQHELSRPVSPAASPPPPSMSVAETILPIAAPSQETLVQAPSVRSRDFAYNNRTNPSFPDFLNRPRGPPGTMSPQSRTSTRISEFDILGPSRSVRGGGAKSIQGTLDSYGTGPSTSSLSLKAPPTRSRTPGPSVTDRPPSPRGPRSYSDPTAPPVPPDARPVLDARRRTSSDNRGPLVQLFKKRFRSRTSPPDTGSGSRSGSLSTGRAVPDITVEGPSSPESTESHPNTASALDLLSPEHANRPLPEPVVHMRQEPEAPLPIPTKEVLDVLPPGFIPIPPPSSQGRNRRPSGPSRPVTPYEEAPLPGGVAYPNPPSRSRTPSAIDDLYGAASPRSIGPRGAADSRGSLGAASTGLSPLSFGKPLSFFPDDAQEVPIS